MSEDAFKEMKWMSNTTGLVYEAQVNQLQKLAKLCFAPESAVISISEQSRYVKCESSGSENPTTQKFPSFVQAVLGNDWTVQMCYNVPNATTGKSSGKRNRTKPKGKRRVRATRRKQRNTPRSKN